MSFMNHESIFQNISVCLSHHIALMHRYKQNQCRTHEEPVTRLQCESVIINKIHSITSMKYCEVIL